MVSAGSFYFALTGSLRSVALHFLAAFNLRFPFSRLLYLCRFRLR